MTRGGTGGSRSGETSWNTPVTCASALACTDVRCRQSGSSGSTIRIPLHHLRVKQPVPAGMNPLRVCAIADTLRNRGGEIWDPVLVRRVGPDDWLILDGRHRFVASLFAGVPDLLCVEEA